jgi:hypothetical protein
MTVTTHDWIELGFMLLIYVCGMLQGARDERASRPRQSTRRPD